MIKNREEAILNAVKVAKRSGFKATAIKVELEANLNRITMDVGECQAFMMKELRKLGLAEFRENDWRRLAHGTETQWWPVAPLVYGEFYNDGSVDSEFTFTIKLDKPKNILVLPKVVKAFKRLAKENGQGMDVRGAGMHMAFLNSRDCSYPSGGSSISASYWGNFAKSMNLLMPALYFLGSSNEQSRGLNFRRPEVGWDTHRSAIDFRHGALEFRVFDTCYDNPEAILDNFVVMTKCLRYWRTEFVPSGLEKVTTSYRFGVDRGDTLDRFYVSHTHIDLLNQGLARLKPSYYTIREIKQQRKFQTNKRSLNKRKEDLRKMVEAQYKEYEDRFNFQLLYKELRFTREFLEAADFNMTVRPSSSADFQALRLEAEAKAKEKVEEAKRRKKSVKSYVNETLKRIEREDSGSYVLSV